MKLLKLISLFLLLSSCAPQDIIVLEDITPDATPSVSPSPEPTESPTIDSSPSPSPTPSEPPIQCKKIIYLPKKVICVRVGDKNETL